VEKKCFETLEYVWEFPGRRPDQEGNASILTEILDVMGVICLTLPAFFGRPYRSGVTNKIMEKYQ
jgi:hypothetical protein